MGRNWDQRPPADLQRDGHLAVFLRGDDVRCLGQQHLWQADWQVASR